MSRDTAGPRAGQEPETGWRAVQRRGSRVLSLSASPAARPCLPALARSLFLIVSPSALLSTGFLSSHVLLVRVPAKTYKHLSIPTLTPGQRVRLAPQAGWWEGNVVSTSIPSTLPRSRVGAVGEVGECLGSPKRRAPWLRLYPESV